MEVPNDMAEFKALWFFKMYIYIDDRAYTDQSHKNSKYDPSNWTSSVKLAPSCCVSFAPHGGFQDAWLTCASES